MKITDELKHRIQEHQSRLEAELHRLQADHGNESRERKQQLEHTLGEVKRELEAGWDNLSREAAERINQRLQR